MDSILQPIVDELIVLFRYLTHVMRFIDYTLISCFVVAGCFWVAKRLADKTPVKPSRRRKKRA